jgi:hypothetical protein
VWRQATDDCSGLKVTNTLSHSELPTGLQWNHFKFPKVSLQILEGLIGLEINLNLLNLRGVILASGDNKHGEPPPLAINLFL